MQSGLVKFVDKDEDGEENDCNFAGEASWTTLHKSFPV